MNDILHWFDLKAVSGIGNHLFKRLINRFKSPENVFNASSEELLEVEGISSRLVSAIYGHKTPDWVKKEIDSVIKKGYKIIKLTDSDYPCLLVQIPDPPPFLYVYGNLTNTAKSIAVVGTRNATPHYGVPITKRLCSDLACLDIFIVSGMAKGIDTAAHEGALMGKGKTVAVLGSGLEEVYPPENLKLFHKIAENGAVISEFRLTEKPESYHFPIRNRVISGISLGTVVVEAGSKSGALITARFALEQGREVFAIPGNIHSYKSYGTHNLIKQGAKLVSNAQDIIEELSHMIKIHIANETVKKDEILNRLPPLSDEESLVFKALSPYPVHIDDLVRKISMDVGKLSSILLQLELKGVVLQSPGKLFSLEIKDMFQL